MAKADLLQSNSRIYASAADESRKDPASATLLGTKEPYSSNHMCSQSLSTTQKTVIDSSVRTQMKANTHDLMSWRAATSTYRNTGQSYKLPMYRNKTSPSRKTALTQEPDLPIILHVTESFGGGVATALAQYVLSTPELEHHLLMGEREGDFSDSGELALFRSIESLPSNAFAAVASIRRQQKRLQPDVVHAHSSFAGAFVRIANVRSHARRIVYTPHGYSFEREDITPLHKLAFRTAERALSLNTSVTAACSPREHELTKDINWSRPTVYVPNVAITDASDSPGNRQGEKVPGQKPVTVAAVGRLTAARDPLFFQETARILNLIEPEVEVVWIGGGDDHYVEGLERTGVRVTGWLDRKKAMAELAAADLHVHTAAWDGFPMVLLESNSLRIPSLVRPIVAFSHLDAEVLAETPGSMAHKIALLSKSHSERSKVLKIWDSALSENTRSIQKLRLKEAYGML